MKRYIGLIVLSCALAAVVHASENRRTVSNYSSSPLPMVMSSPATTGTPVTASSPELMMPPPFSALAAGTPVSAVPPPPFPVKDKDRYEACWKKCMGDSQSGADVCAAFCASEQ